MDLTLRPTDDECFDYHRDYVAKVPDGNIIATLEKQVPELSKFIASIATEQWDVIHPPYGWSVSTVVSHCCDAERVFGYRILRFSTGDPTDLPGWDENHYASCGYTTTSTREELGVELGTLRMANIRLLSRLSESGWAGRGTADGRIVSVRTLAWLMAGHWLHHQAILQTRLA